MSNYPPVKSQLSLLGDLNMILPDRKSISSDGKKLITCFVVLFVCVCVFFFVCLSFTSIGKVEHFTGSNVEETEIRARDLSYGTSCTANSLCDLG